MYFLNDQRSKLTKEASLDQYNFISSYFSTSCYYCLRLIFIHIIAYKEKSCIWNMYFKFLFFDLCLQTIELNHRTYICVYTHTHTHKWTSRVVLVVKNLLPNAEDIKDAGSIPGLRRSPGGEHGNHASILA